MKTNQIKNSILITICLLIININTLTPTQFTNYLQGFEKNTNNLLENKNINMIQSSQNSSSSYTSSTKTVEYRSTENFNRERSFEVLNQQFEFLSNSLNQNASNIKLLAVFENLKTMNLNFVYELTLNSQDTFYICGSFNNSTNKVSNYFQATNLSEVANFLEIDEQIIMGQADKYKNVNYNNSKFNNFKKDFCKNENALNMVEMEKSVYIKIQELNENKISTLNSEYSKLDEELLLLQQNVAQQVANEKLLIQQINEKQANIMSLERELDSLMTKQQELNTSSGQLDIDRNNLQTEIENMKSSNKNLNKQNRKLNKQINRNSKRLERLNNREENLLSNNYEKEMKIKNLSSKLENIRNNISNRNNKSNQSFDKSSVLNSKLNFMNLLLNLQNELSNTQVMFFDETQDNLKKLQDTNNFVQSLNQDKSIKRKYNKKLTQLNKKIEKVNQIRNRKNDIQMKLNKKQESIQQQFDNLFNLNQELTSIRNQNNNFSNYQNLEDSIQAEKKEIVMNFKEFENLRQNLEQTIVEEQNETNSTVSECVMFTEQILLENSSSSNESSFKEFIQKYKENNYEYTSNDVNSILIENFNSETSSQNLSQQVDSIELDNLGMMDFISSNQEINDNINNIGSILIGSARP